MARPREFDTEQAVDRAMEAFWRWGYSGANLPALLRAMGISRGSFYKAFGEKRAVYLRALQRYKERELDLWAARLASGSDPGVTRIAQAFEAVVEAAETGDRRGCLLCLTISGPAIADDQIRRAAYRQLDAVVDAFEAALRDHAVEAGEADTGHRADAHALTAAYIGLRGLARSGADVEVLRDAGQATISRL